MRCGIAQCQSLSAVRLVASREMLLTTGIPLLLCRRSHVAVPVVRDSVGRDIAFATQGKFGPDSRELFCVLLGRTPNGR